jgi:hypothetical protein
MQGYQISEIWHLHEENPVNVSNSDDTGTVHIVPYRTSLEILLGLDGQVLLTFSSTFLTAPEYDQKFNIR